MSYRRVLIFLLACAAMVLVVPFAMRIFVAPHVYVDKDAVPLSEVVIIPGASVVHGEPSSILAERIDAAIVLYQVHRVHKILVTGDNGDRNYDEVTATLTYLREHDIPAQDIFLDRAGFDTYSSMYRAHFLFGAHSAVIATQDFHLPRAVFIARSLGMEASGFAASGGGGVRDYVREIPASIKALIDLAVHRIPQYANVPIVPANASGTK